MPDVRAGLRQASAARAAGGQEIIKMIEDAIFLPWPLKHADWSIYNLSVRAALLTHPRCIAPGVENANEMEREKQSGN